MTYQIDFISATIRLSHHFKLRKKELDANENDNDERKLVLAFND